MPPQQADQPVAADLPDPVDAADQAATDHRALLPRRRFAAPTRSSALRLGRKRSPRALLWLAIVVVNGPLLLELAKTFVAFPRDYAPYGDLALSELVTRQVGHGSVLLGPYSRFGFHHPGPTLFYLWAVPYHLTARTSLSLVATSLLTGIASLTGSCLLLFRRGGWRLLAPALVAIALLVDTAGLAALRQPWNPFVTILPFLALCVVAWSIIDGDRVALLPVAVGVGSFVAQSHLSYAPAVGGVLLAAVVSLVVRARTAGWRPLRVPAAIALGVLVLMWLPPVIEQLTAHPGNMTLLARYNAKPHPMPGLVHVRPYVMTELGRLPAALVGVSAKRDFLGFDSLPERFGWCTLAAGVVATLAAALLRRWRPVTMAVVAAIVTLAAYVTASRLEGLIATYLILWIAVAAVLWWTAVGWTVGEIIGVRWRRALAAVALTVALVVTASTTTAVARLDGPQAETSRTLQALTSEMGDDIRRLGGAPVLVHIGPSTDRDVDMFAYLAGLVLVLERAGVRTAVDPRWTFVFGDRSRARRNVRYREVTIAYPGQEPARRFVGGGALWAQADGVVVFAAPAP